MLAHDRSPHAHAHISAIDASKARKAPGVLAVLTATELAGLVEPLGCVMALSSRDGTSRAEADRPVIATDRVRHVGEPVAFIVAEKLAQAQDAAERVTVAYEGLPAYVDPLEQMPSVPIWPDIPEIVCFESEEFSLGAQDRDHMVMPNKDAKSGGAAGVLEHSDLRMVTKHYVHLPVSSPPKRSGARLLICGPRPDAVIPRRRSRRLIFLVRKMCKLRVPDRQV
jgi:hypothetical protein